MSIKLTEEQKRPNSEIVNGYKIVYPIWREDLAEALLIPVTPEKAK